LSELCPDPKESSFSVLGRQPLWMRTLVENPVNSEVDDDSVDFSSQEASNFELPNQMIIKDKKSIPH
jgi:hypothetical protein